MGEKEIKKKIGDSIRVERKRAGLSQEGLAFECGLHRTYIGAVERGERNISLINLYKISKAMGISLSTLMELSDL